MADTVVRKHIIFYGRVQDVGFRYFSVYKARLLGLAGWVKNLDDGSVEMEVQGKEAKIDMLIQLIATTRTVLYMYLANGTTVLARTLKKSL